MLQSVFGLVQDTCRLGVSNLNPDRNRFALSSCFLVPASGLFEKETVETYSGAKNVADFETDSCFESAFRRMNPHIPPTLNNWMCYDFKRRIMPTHYTIRTTGDNPSCYGQRDCHLKWRLAEISADGQICGR
jgi:hypothetical protein